MRYLDDALVRSGGQPLPVEYILSTNPAATHTGKLTPDAVEARAELDPEEGAIVKLRVQLESMDGVSRRPGAEVIGDVNCGKRSAAFVWFHEVVEWVQANLLF